MPYQKYQGPAIVELDKIIKIRKICTNIVYMRVQKNLRYICYDSQQKEGSLLPNFHHPPITVLTQQSDTISSEKAFLLP